jgi:hypothetical protein
MTQKFVRYSPDVEQNEPAIEGSGVDPLPGQGRD